MNLVFNCLNSGLGNGGGSKTTIMCAKTLEALGHRCDIVATDDNFTWFSHKPVIKYIPKDTDIIIATACTTVLSTLQSSIRKKAYYVRGHEVWMWDEKQLAACYNAGLFNITNSYGLKNKLKEFGANSIVVHQGIDLEDWQDKELRLNDKIRIGCLYQKKSTKRWCDFVKLANILGSKDYEYVAFGTEIRKDSFLDGYICSPTHEQLVDLYSSCHIFFLPTILEGLHNIGLEAGLCGCLLVGNSSPLNGMIYDYLFDGKTGMVYPLDDIFSAAEIIKNPKWELVEEAKHFITNNIGSRETNMKKFVSYLEKI